MLSVISEGLRLPVVISFPSATKSSSVFIALDVGPLSYSPIAVLSKRTAVGTAVSPRGKFRGQQQRAAWKGAVLTLKCRSCFAAQSRRPRLLKRGKWCVQLIAAAALKGSDFQEIQTNFTLKPRLLFSLGRVITSGTKPQKAAPWEAKGSSAFPYSGDFYLVLHCAGLYGVAQEKVFLLKQSSPCQKEEEKGSHRC